MSVTIGIQISTTADRLINRFGSTSELGAKMATTMDLVNQETVKRTYRALARRMFRTLNKSTQHEEQASEGDTRSPKVNLTGTHRRALFSFVLSLSYD